MSADLIGHYRMMARYNRLANRRIYDACASLPDAERTKIRPAFFKSIHGTLNHILVGDRIWMTRFGGGDVPSTSLDAILYEEFGALRRARQEADGEIEEFADALSPAFLDGSIRYENNEGRIFDDAMPMLLTHFFNHQTHHRGQIHDMLTQTDVPPPVLDLHRVLKPDPD